MLLCVATSRSLRPDKQFHRCKTNAVYRLLFVRCREAERFIEGNAVRRRIECDRLSVKVLPKPPEQFSSDAAPVIIPVYEEKADVAFFFPDAKYSDKFFSIERAIVDYPFKIGIIFQALAEYLRALRRVIRRSILDEFLKATGLDIR